MVAMAIWVVRWYKDKSYSVSSRTAMNWLFPFLLGVSLLTLSVSYSNGDPDVLYLISSIIISLMIWILSGIAYSKKFERLYINKTGNGSTTIDPRFEIPSQKQLEEQKEYESLTDEEKEEWYLDYCKNNKLLNPIIAITIQVIFYIVELYCYIKFFEISI